MGNPVARAVACRRTNGWSLLSSFSRAILIKMRRSGLVATVLGPEDPELRVLAPLDVLFMLLRPVVRALDVVDAATFA
jgi:hypothetical protein